MATPVTRPPRRAEDAMNASALLDANASETPVFCGEELQRFRAGYGAAHGYLSLLVCLFGSVANSLNIAVLTRREMLSPTNSILTGLAVADLLVMLEYVPFALHMHLLRRPDELKFTYAWAAFVHFHSNFAQVCHTVSIWLTVTLAVWRYLAVAQPQRSRQWCSMRTTLFAIAWAYLLSPLLCVPLFLSGSVRPLVRGNATLYVVGVSDLALANGSLLGRVNIWIYSVCIKLVPCVALTLLSLRLIKALVETKRRRRHLTLTATKQPPQTQTPPAQQLQQPPTATTRLQEKERQTDRTTRMLLAVLLLFLITELPQGVLGLLSVLLGDAFFRQCYVPLGDLMDGLALVNSAVNFILYCSMSRQFRVTFGQLFRPRALDRWIPVPDVSLNGNTTNNVTQVTQL